MLEALNQHLLEIKLLGPDGAILRQRELAQELTEGLQVLLDLADRARGAANFVGHLVELDLIDQETALEDLTRDLDRHRDGLRVADLANELDVDAVEGLVLARDALREDVVDEPGQVDSLLVFALFWWFGVCSFGGSLGSALLLLCLLEDELADGVAILVEVVLAGVVALELDLVDDVLRWLLKRQVFDEVLKAQTVLLVIRSFMDLLIDLLLPGDMLGVWHLLLLQDGGHGAHHVWIERSGRVEAVGLAVQRHPWQSARHLRWLLARHLLGLRLHVD